MVTRRKLRWNADGWIASSASGTQQRSTRSANGWAPMRERSRLMATLLTPACGTPASSGWAPF